MQGQEETPGPVFLQATYALVVQSKVYLVLEDKMKIPFFLGRLIFGGFFLYNGINHFRQRKMFAQYAASKNVPKAELAVVASGTALTLGGASILLGLKPKWGALAVIGFLAGVTPIMHDFWHMEDQGQRMNDMVNFWKNMALLGGALALMSVEEPWPASVSLEEPSIQQKARRVTRQIAA